MFLGDIFSAIGGGAEGGLDAYSFKKKLDEEEQARQDRLEAAATERAYRSSRDRIGDTRYDAAQQRDNAEITASMLQPNQELDAPTFDRLKNTPFAARVQTTSSLPSTSGDPFDMGAATSDPGGRAVRTWMPTAAEARQEAGDRRRQTAYGALPIKLKQLADVVDATGDKSIDLKDLATPEELAADEHRQDTRLVTRSNAIADHEDALIRGRDAGRDTKGSDDPTLPNGVQDYLLTLSQTPGLTFDQALTKITRDMPQLQQQHPRLQPLKVNTALRALFARDPDAPPANSPAAAIAAIAGGRGAPPPVTPRGAAPAGPLPSRSAQPPAPKVVPGQVVTVRGKQYTVGKVYPDGTWDPAP